MNTFSTVHVCIGNGLCPAPSKNQGSVSFVPAKAGSTPIKGSRTYPSLGEHLLRFIYCIFFPLSRSLKRKLALAFENKSGIQKESVQYYADIETNYKIYTTSLAVYFKFYCI
jgi:hypothetical protein